MQFIMLLRMLREMVFRYCSCLVRSCLVVSRLVSSGHVGSGPVVSRLDKWRSKLSIFQSPGTAPVLSSQVESRRVRSSLVASRRVESCPDKWSRKYRSFNPLILLLSCLVKSCPVKSRQVQSGQVESCPVASSLDKWRSKLSIFQSPGTAPVLSRRVQSSQVQSGLVRSGPVSSCLVMSWISLGSQVNHRPAFRVFSGLGRLVVSAHQWQIHRLALEP
jgi:hypothetical protein